jgi:hypothetical protein
MFDVLHGMTNSRLRTFLRSRDYLSGTFDAASWRALAALAAQLAGRGWPTSDAQPYSLKAI